MTALSFALGIVLMALGAFWLGQGLGWKDAEILPSLSELTWSPWRLSWTPSQEAEHTLVVRAVDGTGELQSGQVRPSFPRGADGYHRVRVTVAR